MTVSSELGYSLLHVEPRLAVLRSRTVAETLNALASSGVYRRFEDRRLWGCWPPVYPVLWGGGLWRGVRFSIKRSRFR